MIGYTDSQILEIISTCPTLLSCSSSLIKSKIEEMIHKRKSEDEELQHDIVMISIPIQKKETCNL